MSRPLCLICGQKFENHGGIGSRCPDYSTPRHERTQQWSKTETYVPSDGFLTLLLDALGWQGGTVADALAEVRRLRSLTLAMSAKIQEVSRNEDVMPFPSAIESGSPRCPDLAKWLRELDAMTDQPKPIGQGVAALLPEYGEVKRG